MINHNSTIKPEDRAFAMWRTVTMRSAILSEGNQPVERGFGIDFATWSINNHGLLEANFPPVNPFNRVKRHFHPQTRTIKKYCHNNSVVLPSGPLS